MRMVAPLVLAALLAACGGQGPAPSPPGQLAGASARGTPVRQGNPNKGNVTPAFPEQTRAPEARSNVTLNVETVAEGIDHPWGSAILPDDGSILVASKSGKLWLVAPGKPKVEIKGAPKVDSRGQGGLLDISLGPDFLTSRTVYFSFSEDRGGGRNGTSLGKATLSADRSRLENPSTIFRQEPAWASTAHYGASIEWDPTGNLYLTLGERSDSEPRKLAQDLGALLGKVVRLKADGTPADGNPFLGQANVRPEIWSYGHRNPQGAAINPDTGKLWTIEHGPRGGDEINIPEAGKNYGWPVISYGIEYFGGPIGDGITSKAGMEQPVYYWDPVIAPGDMIFYSGNLFPWKGDLLIAALGTTEIVRLDIEGDRVVGEERIMSDHGRIRDITEAPDGSLYVLVDDSGKVLRVTPQR